MLARSVRIDDGQTQLPDGRVVDVKVITFVDQDAPLSRTVVRILASTWPQVLEYLTDPEAIAEKVREERRSEATRAEILRGVGGKVPLSEPGKP